MKNLNQFFFCVENISPSSTPPPSSSHATNKQFLCAIKNILFISPIKKKRNAGPRRKSAVNLFEKALSIHGPNHPLSAALFHPSNILAETQETGLSREKETFYAHLSHFEEFRLKNSSKQFMGAA